MRDLHNRTLARFLEQPGRFALFGSGETGASVFHALAHAGLKPAFFLDDDRTGECLGLEIRPPEEALTVDTVVTAGPYARDMTVQLRADGFEGAVLDLTHVHRPESAILHDEARLDEAEDAQQFARSLLEDDGSREVFDGVLAYRRRLDPGHLPPAPLDEAHLAVPAGEGAWVLDVGSDPDALLELAERIGPEGRIHALEPDEARRLEIEDAAAGHAAGARLVVHPLRCERSCRVRSRGDDAPAAVSVDEFVWEQTCGRVDRIQLLGPRAAALLHGASATLGEHRPALVVRLGQGPADLWEAPIGLKERSPGYRLHLAHHSQGPNDTRLYGSPPEGC